MSKAHSPFVVPVYQGLILPRVPSCQGIILFSGPLCAKESQPSVISGSHSCPRVPVCVRSRQIGEWPLTTETPSGGKTGPWRKFIT